MAIILIECLFTSYICTPEHPFKWRALAVLSVPRKSFSFSESFLKQLSSYFYFSLLMFSFFFAYVFVFLCLCLYFYSDLLFALDSACRCCGVTKILSKNHKAYSTSL